MKTHIFYIYICLTAAVTVLSASCDDSGQGDAVKPVIELHEPAEGDVLKTGSDVHFEMDLSDDVELKSYKVNIHPNFDGHSHNKAGEETEATVDFEFERSWDVSGKKNEHVHHHEIEIPENATPGAYHLMVYCTDAAGNEAHIAVNIELSHDGEEHDHDDDEHDHDEHDD
ncbi:MAG: DUF4625 domain-containing protein [Bacteroidales bacterium]|jgi:hypothetical protein|nr:DUF4625 domain-containing protein [Bacteroidales bacterium]